MQGFDSYGGQVQILQVWKISSDGAQTGSPSASVEVEATIDSEKVPANSYAAFATANTCDALYLHGNTSVDSYDSSTEASGTAHPTTVFANGDVGSNGNIHVQGSFDLGGNIYSPRTGVGACSAGGVTAETLTGGGWTQNGSLMKLPHVLVYPPPVFSVVPPTTTVTVDSTLLGTPATACSSLGLTLGTNCAVDAAAQTVTVTGHGTDVTMPNVVISSGYKLIIVGNQPAAQNVNINSFSGDLQINANLGATDVGESVVMKISGKNADGTEMTTPFTLGNWTINSNFKFDASTLQLVYGGHAAFSMQGNNSASASIYAPNAAFALKGTSDLYGSILAATIDNGGVPSIHYDSSLQNKFFVQGHPMLGTVTWKRF